jgi:hypothetical protein
LVHLKTDPPLEQDEPPVPLSMLDSLRSKNILAESQSEHMASWLYFVQTKAVAEWACNAASRMVADFLSKIPDSKFQFLMREGYGRIGAGRFEVG